MRFCWIADKDRPAGVLQAEDLGIVSFDLTQLVHELELVDPDVSGPIAGRQLFAVMRNPDATNPVSLIVSLLGSSLGVGRVGLLDVVEVRVDVDGLQELVGVDVSLVDSVGGHVVVHVPDSNGVVRAARDERTGR